MKDVLHITVFLVGTVILALLTAMFIRWLDIHHWISCVVFALFTGLLVQWLNLYQHAVARQQIQELEDEIQLFNDLGMCVDHTEE